MNGLPGILIRVGLVLLVFGIFKKTTVETSWGEIYNLGLMHQKTIWIFLGAAMFVGGLILKSKKIDDSSTSDERGDFVMDSGREIFGEFVGVNRIIEKFKFSVAYMHAKLNAFRGQFFLRLGLALGAALILIGSSIVYLLIVPVTLFLFIILSMRQMNVYQAIRKMIMIALIFSVVGLVLTLLIALDGPAGGGDYYVQLMLSFVVNIILILGYLKFRRLSN